MKLRGAGGKLEEFFTSAYGYAGNRIGSIFAQCSTVVDEMSAAVMARGFDKDRPRTSYLEVNMHVLDWLIAAVAILLTVWNLVW